MKRSWIGTGLLAAIMLICAGALPWALGPDPGSNAGTPRYEHQDARRALQSPTLSSTTAEDGTVIPASPLGTDRLGRNMLARCILGGAISLSIGLTAAIVAVVIGLLVGGIAGFAGGKVDAILMRTVDVLYGLPNILIVVLLAVAVDGILDRNGGELSAVQRQAVNIGTMLIAIGAVSWLTLARVIRGQVLSLKAQPFMEAARAIGVRPVRQFIHHILPNLVGPIAVYAALTVPAAILSESFLSFLGIGVREPLPSWGNLAALGLSELNTIQSRWWLLFWPCLLLATTLIGLNLAGDQLRARVDPRRRTTRTNPDTQSAQPAAIPGRKPRSEA